MASLLNSLQSQHSSCITFQSHPASAPAGMPGACFPAFKFRSRQEPVDWRRISAIDVEKVASELDFITLQENIVNVTFCDVGKERCPYCQNPVDPVLLKMFRLAQLTTEYLLHSQEYLTSSLQALEEKLQASVLEKEQIRKEIENHAEEVKSLKEECKRRKRIITSQQMMIEAGANNYHKCPHCDKAFMNYSFLQSHVERRHPEEVDIAKQKKEERQKLQDEVNKLKEQLLHAQSHLEAEHQSYMIKMSEEHEHLKTKEEGILRRFEKWKEEEREKLSCEMEKMKEMFTKEFKELSTKNSTLENQLLEVKNSSIKLKSNLGTLKDDQAHDFEQERHRYQRDLQSLKELLEKQESRWTSRIESLQKEHEKEKYKYQLEVKGLKSYMTATEDQQANVTLYNKRIDELSQKLQEQKEMIITQKEQIYELSSRPSEKVTVCSEQSMSTRLLEPIEEVSEEDKENVHGATSCSKENLVNVLKKNPSLIQELRPILEQALLERLEALGIKPGVRGIPSHQINKILATVESNREEKGKRIPDFHLIRERLAHQLNVSAQKESSIYSNIVVTASSNFTSEEKQEDGPSGLFSIMKEKTAKFKTTVKQHPQPTPRAEHKAGNTPLSSSPRTLPFSSEESENDDVIFKNFQTQMPLHSRNPITSISSLMKDEPSDTDWTEGSEIEEMDPRLFEDRSLHREVSSMSLGNAAAKELKVKNKERIAGGGFQKNEPFGGVLVKQTAKKDDIVRELKLTDVDEDDWDISSLEDDKSPVVKTKAVKTRSAVCKSSDSTTSHNTSPWGTSAGKGMKGGPIDGGTSTLKSSMVTVTDWSDSSDIENI
ncbi:cilium assembly protein DZIP1 isoform X1 [Latimeria chalumnae]|uniref:cilium assembly protein DZIP1 isoform X1 n=1 Tax=Latimeria chalumnae TaxID=7897 RepID=UPI0006D9162F|nr:PREDICTED: zinc finger protein DZIP1 isoform X2 [Latimeria chalumnae]|eukprot:XP_014353630.1 PREDICTED: zinc finger protein DZIP1 isoform X2 [Latimeria chalumnae]